MKYRGKEEGSDEDVTSARSPDSMPEKSDSSSESMAGPRARLRAANF